MSIADGAKELTAHEAANAFVMLWTKTRGRTTEGLRDGITSLLTEAYKRGYDAGFREGQRAI